MATSPPWQENEGDLKSMCCRCCCTSCRYLWEVVHTRKKIKLNNRYKFWQKPQVVDSRARAVSRLFVEFLSFQSFRVAAVYI